MEKLVKKTMTAFLVLLTLMIPISAAPAYNVEPNLSVSQVAEDSETMRITFDTYSNSTTAVDAVVTLSGDTQIVYDTEQTFSLNSDESNSFVVFALDRSEISAGETYNVTVAVSGTDLTQPLAATEYNLTVTGSSVASEPNLVADDDYENEVSPGDTIVLELELENDQTVYNDVSVEAYLVDGSGLRVSEIQESNEFNLVEDEEEVITMEFEVEQDLEAGDYEIYVEITSDEGLLFVHEYPVTVERADNSLVVTDLRVSNAAAGETVDVAVTILNNGQTDEDNVLVSLSVAGQTVTSDYFTVEEDEELVRYFTLTLPSGASGNELVTVAVANEDVSVSSSTTVNVEARNQAASLTEEQVAALLEARLNQGNNNGFDDLSLGWLVAGLLVVYLLVSNRGLMPTTSRATSTSSRGRRSSKKYY